MSRELLTEPQAWRRAAKIVDGLPIHREGYLCDRVRFMAGAFPYDRSGERCDPPIISFDVRAQMLARIDHHLGAPTVFSAYPDLDDTPELFAEARAARVLACLWLALECDDEARRARKSARRAKGA